MSTVWPRTVGFYCLYDESASFSGELFEKLPFFTCWSRKNEELMLKGVKITKSILSAEVPNAFNITLEFHGYDTPLKCVGNISNPLYHNMWTGFDSTLVS